MWLNCHLWANQYSTETKSLYFLETPKMSAEYNLYSYIYTCMKTWPCFEKQMCLEAGWDGARELFCYSVTLTCHAFSYSKLLITPLVHHRLEIIVMKVKMVRAIWKNCWTAPWKFSEWIYSRLRIISRTRSRAIQELNEEIYCHFCFVNSSKKFQHLCGSWKPLREINGQNIFTWTPLCLQRIIIEICRGFN